MNPPSFIVVQRLLLHGVNSWEHGTATAASLQHWFAIIRRVGVENRRQGLDFNEAEAWELEMPVPSTKWHASNMETLMESDWGTLPTLLLLLIEMIAYKQNVSADAKVPRSPPLEGEVPPAYWGVIIQISLPSTHRNQPGLMPPDSKRTLVNWEASRLDLCIPTAPLKHCPTS